jgi:antitoxin component YwqK of YwqJK toxin-antitoxin module
MSKNMLKPQVAIPLTWAVAFFFWQSCSDESLEERARKIIDSNESDQSQPTGANEDLIRSPDGRQFTEVAKDKANDQSVGFTQEGSLAFKGELKNGKPEGAWTTFFPDGSIRWKGVKKEGLNHGPFTMWYENGKVKMDGNFKNGKKDGKSTHWYQSGKKWREQWHKNGEPSGIWKTWNEDGELVEKLNQSPPETDRNESAN